MVVIGHTKDSLVAFRLPATLALTTSDQFGSNHKRQNSMWLL